MDRGSGNYGVKFTERGKKTITQWFEKERVRKEAYHNYCRDPKFSGVEMVERKG